MTEIALDGYTLTSAEVLRIASGEAKVSLSTNAIPRVHAVSYTHLTLPTKA